MADVIEPAVRALVKDTPTLDSTVAHAIVLEPNWANAHAVHDWRNHVPDSFKRVWDDLSLSVRMAVLLMASALADAEEWN